LKAARASEKIRGIMALIELEYRQGMVGANQFTALVKLQSALEESFRTEDKAMQEAVLLQLNSLMQSMQGSQGASQLSAVTQDLYDSLKT